MGRISWIFPSIALCVNVAYTSLPEMGISRCIQASDVIGLLEVAMPTHLGVLDLGKLDQVVVSLHIN